ncbi:sensor histidine kinase [Terriglobus roseus]|uniref:histidine kinase n=1 Tax=Terriglobus roseus TaxID=392734 RepID=A0A1G7MXE8_9BACT|nr:ATP-binding protein [Terriglobus roseus]SDF66351.1 Histidine kinase-, DNA gyrase B-, and HSP90-like ATPase [Terriglobus roseus]
MKEEERSEVFLDSAPWKPGQHGTESTRSVSYELRMRLWLAAIGAILLLLCGTLFHTWGIDNFTIFVALLTLGILWLFLAERALHRIVTPLQTLTNVIAAIRSEDFSFRVRGARRGDAAGDLAKEINLLSESLQAQKRDATEARALVDRVLSTMDAPVLAFAEDGALAMVNRAARTALGLQLTDIGCAAEELHVESLLELEDSTLMPQPPRGLSGRWMLRRSAFRLQGRRHLLVMLTEIGSALREEERQAWQRLIRVLGHEINNSLAPIKSIAGTLQLRLTPETDSENNTSRDAQLRKGLAIIEARADSLNRFLQGYRKLSALPTLQRQPIAVLAFMQQVTALDHGVPVTITESEDRVALIDPVLMEQAMINLLKNAAEATLERSTHEGSAARPIEVMWRVAGDDLVIEIRDYGLGVLNESNLFVPFYTTKPEGSGIGLLLTQHVVEAHSGTIQLANHPSGVGCIVSITVPA